MTNEVNFISNHHIIYQDGQTIAGSHYGEWRMIKVRKTIGNVYRISIQKLHPESHRAVSKVLGVTPVLYEETNEGFKLVGEEGHFLVQMARASISSITWTRNGRATLYLRAPGKLTINAINIPLDKHLKEVDDAGSKVLIEKYDTIVRSFEDGKDVTMARASYYLVLGKVQFMKGSYREAKESFTQCNMELIFKGQLPIHDAIFWFGKVSEAEGKVEEARQFYELAMERFREGEDGVTRKEIEEAMRGLPLTPSLGRRNRGPL